ncbi:kinase-like domain-containing protein [Microdochium trichocladiopsis]|uniref:Kinase-like domain-containing protein n=1 Tax=Microdochium trichocladiopsis TaxID=1682393 RepID=A0A9P9BIR6_9PEZI|nr:kinase-like domain-containing protein [Microdochium trichocladiopsis]KAH7014643.1 kinase-like domain-containing protein [Microdochium trichocladiopsis]
MARPDTAALAWAATVLGGDVTVDRGLREGGSPWLIRAAGKPAVLRIAPQANSGNVRTEVAAMRHAAMAGLPVPEALGHDDVLWRATEAVERVKPADTQVVFVHGDLWDSNTLWDGIKLTAILDWDASGIGSPGIDLGSFRFDAALCYGPSAAAEVLSGWEEEAGRPALDVAYWDAVAALATPPDMGWVQPAMADQGRPDLTAELLTERREEFLDQALRELEQ